MWHDTTVLVDLCPELFEYNTDLLIVERTSELRIRDVFMPVFALWSSHGKELA